MTASVGRWEGTGIFAAAAACACVAGCFTPAISMGQSPPTEIVREDHFAGESTDMVYDAGSDAFGNVYIAGYTTSVDFPQRGGLGLGYVDDDPDDGRSFDQAFVRKYAPDGDLVYSTLLPPEMRWLRSISVDQSGAVYALGINQKDQGPEPSRVIKLDPSGTSVLYSEAFGEGADSSTDIAVDHAGRAFITGYSWQGFEATPGAWREEAPGNGHGTLTRLGPSGDRGVATYLGGRAETVAIAPNGDPVVGGFARPGEAGAVPGVSSGQDEPDGKDGFISRFSPQLDEIRFASYLGGSGDDTFDAIAAAPDGTLYAGGTTDATQLDQLLPLEPPEPGGGAPTKDVFFTELSADGETVRQLAGFGGEGLDELDELAVAADGAVVFAGTYESDDFPQHGSVDGVLPNVPFAARVADGVLTHATLYVSSTSANFPGAMALTVDGLVHLGGIEAQVFNNIDGNLVSLRLNPFVDSPAVTLPRRQRVEGALQARTTASEPFISRAWGNVWFRSPGEYRRVRVISDPSSAGQYGTARLRLRSQKPAQRRTLRRGLRSRHPIKVSLTARFSDAEGNTVRVRERTRLRGSRRR